MGQHREPHPDRLSQSVEAAATSPAPWTPAPAPTRPAMAQPRRLGCQRRPDHLGAVTTTKQAIGADQHVRDRTTGGAALAWSTALDCPPNVERLAIARRRSPRPQSPGAARARQLTVQQGAFDFDGVTSYDVQQCLRASGRTLPSLASDAGRFLASQRRVHPVGPTRRRATRRANPPSPSSMSLRPRASSASAAAHHHSVDPKDRCSTVGGNAPAVESSKLMQSIMRWSRGAKRIASTSVPFV